MEKNNRPAQSGKVTNAERKYPGMAVNDSDGEKVSLEQMNERTCALNNNPRSNK